MNRVDGGWNRVNESSDEIESSRVEWNESSGIEWSRMEWMMSRVM